jgi:hypothetical protein
MFLLSISTYNNFKKSLFKFKRKALIYEVIRNSFVMFLIAIFLSPNYKYLYVMGKNTKRIILHKYAIMEEHRQDCNEIDTCYRKLKEDTHKDEQFPCRFLIPLMISVQDCAFRG